MMKSTKKCPLFSTISLAADGDEVAIEKILNQLTLDQTEGLVTAIIKAVEATQEL